MSAVRRRGLPARGDDTGSLAMALLLVLVGSMFAALLGPVVLTQINNSKYDTRRDHAYDAAQSGVDIMIGKIRDANDGTGNGVRASLPCTATGPITSTVSSGSNEKYQTWVYYFARDPHGHDDWLDDTSKQIACTSSGTALVPAFAVVKSVGTDSPDGTFGNGTRTVQATYVVKSKNVNVAGGLIMADRTSNPTLCLDAGSSSPPVGATPTFQPCSSGSGSQTWAFLTNSTLNLTSTADKATGDLGLCLDAPFPHTTGELITLQKCSSTTIPQQQWTYGGYGANWHATTSATRRDDTMCWNAQSPNTAGAVLTLGGCTSSAYTYEAARSYAQDASVGAGDADAAHKFIVNYNQFGRCVTVNWVSGSTPHLDPSDPNYLPFLLAYTCSPVPDGDTQDQPLNQLWNFPTVATGSTSASGTITNTSLSSKYCIYSPLSDGGYPDTKLCSSLSTAQKTWTVWGDTGNYNTSYRITDSNGMCLQPTDPNAASPDLAGPTSKLIVTACTSSTLQKWNAPPGITSSPVTDYHEK